ICAQFGLDRPRTRRAVRRPRQRRTRTRPTPRGFTNHLVVDKLRRKRDALLNTDAFRSPTRRRTPLECGMTFDSLAAEISSRSPMDMDGASFRLFLVAFREPLPHQTQAIDVAFKVVSDTSEHSGELHLGKDRYSESEIAVFAVDTAKDIVRGRLPPGAVNML